MQATLPNAQNFKVSYGLFIAAWSVWFKRFADMRGKWRSGVMPLGQAEGLLHDRIEKQRFSLDVLTRMLAPWAYRNKCQVNNAFFALNANLVHQVEMVDPVSGERTIGVKLNAAALSYWDSLSFLGQEQFLIRAEARIQADIESPDDYPVILDDAGIALIGEDTYPPIVPEKGASELEFIKALVAWIEDAPHQPMYCRKAIGEAVSGWDNRLLAYFWPKPRVTYAHNFFAHEPLSYHAKPLSDLIEQGLPWNETQNQIAVKIALEVFELAGVPQAYVTADAIYNVFKAALTEDSNATAKMNSGWTRLAAVATAHLNYKQGRLAMACWDGRVSTGVIHRLDFLLSEAGYSSVEGIFNDIGTIPSYGGTRPRTFSLDWPDGYRKWSTQIAGSRLITQVRDILNTEQDSEGNLLYPRMPLPTGTVGDWTVRGVQRVFFCDGY